MYETHFSMLKPFLRGLEVHQMVFDSLFLTFRAKHIIQNLKKLKHYFDSSKLEENHELVPDMDKKIIKNSQSKLLKILGLKNYVN